MSKSHLFIDERPLMLLPKLAAKVGLNEAIVLQQVHYWLIINEEKEQQRPLPERSHYREKRWWTYNSYPQWKEQFPWWSEHTIRRTIQSCEEQGILLSRQFEAGSYDHVKWYSLDYDWEAKSPVIPDVSKTDSGGVQNGPIYIYRDYYRD